MSVIQIILHAQVLTAAVVYVVAAVAGSIVFERVHDVLDHGPLLWAWDHLGMPLLRAGLLLLFILLAYPVLFGIASAPPLAELLDGGEQRLSYLFNTVFVVTLLLPVLGDWRELVLPAQGIAAALLLFVWLARSLEVSVSYWPGWGALALMLLLAFISHWLARRLSASLGRRLDRRLHVQDSGEVLGQSLVLFLQYPVIVVFCQGLGEQL